MEHDLNPKNLQINRIFFLQNLKKPIFEELLGITPKNVSQKSGSVSFLPLRHPNFMKSFRKIISAVLENKRLPTDILT